MKHLAQADRDKPPIPELYLPFAMAAATESKATPLLAYKRDYPLGNTRCQQSNFSNR